jgi:tetratricopeptide (TPR) repeat protein
MLMSRSPAVVATCAALIVAGYPTDAAAQTGFLDAIQELAAIHADEGPADVTGRRTSVLVRMKDALAEWDRNLATLERRVARDLSGAGAGRAFQLHVELGLAYRQRGRLDDALREFDSAAKARPDASDVHLLRALTLEAAGRDSDAGRAFEAAWRRDPANPIKAYLSATRSEDLDAADRERARKVLSDALRRILSTNDSPRGIPFLVLDPVPDTLARAPVVGNAAVAGVFALLAQGRLDDAVAAIGTRTVGRFADADALHQFERGTAEEVEGRHTSARQAYAAALSGTLSGRHLIDVAIGRLAQVEGDLDGAIAAFREAARLHPNDPVIHRELAGAYAAAGRIDEAFAELVAALLIDPRHVAALTMVAQLFLDTDRTEDAIAVLSTAVERDPNSAEAHYGLAVALSRAGRADEAARQFERFERVSGEALERRRQQATGRAAPGAGQK